jgi:hypothetical protein
MTTLIIFPAEMERKVGELERSLKEMERKEKETKLNVDAKTLGVLHALQEYYGVANMDQQVICSISSLGREDATCNMGMMFNIGSTAKGFGYTKDEVNSWIKIELKTITLIPQNYKVQNLSGCYPRTWRLEGSNDDQTWTTLREHTNDTTLSDNKKVETFPLSANNVAFKFFRLIQTGKNSRGDNYLLLSGVELFGKIIVS